MLLRLRINVYPSKEGYLRTNATPNTVHLLNNSSLTCLAIHPRSPRQLPVRSNSLEFGVVLLHLVVDSFLQWANSAAMSRADGLA